MAEAGVYPSAIWAWMCFVWLYRCLETLEPYELCRGAGGGIVHNPPALLSAPSAPFPTCPAVKSWPCHGVPSLPTGDWTRSVPLFGKESSEAVYLENAKLIQRETYPPISIILELASDPSALPSLCAHPNSARRRAVACPLSSLRSPLTSYA